MRRVIAGALTVLSLMAPTWSQESKPETSDSTTATKRPEPDVEFVDSQDAYWVTKAFNDTVYYNGGGSINSVRNERDQFRNDEVLRKIYKPAKVEIKVSSKDAKGPVLKMGDKEVKVP